MEKFKHQVLIHRFIKLQKKIFAGSNLLKYFTMKRWDFRNEQELDKEISEEENKIFPIDDKSDYYQYWIAWVYGIRRYIFKENDSDLPRDKRNMKMYVKLLQNS